MFKPIQNVLLYKNYYFISFDTNQNQYFISLDRPNIEIPLHDFLEACYTSDFKLYNRSTSESTVVVGFSAAFVSESSIVSHNDTEYLLFYHVSPGSNYKSISENGLIPQIGFLSSLIEEEKEAIFLFPNEESMDDALGNWLGDNFDNYFDTLEDEDDDDCEFVLHAFSVLLPLSHFNDYLIPSEVGYECVSSKPIEKEFIFFHSEQ